MGIVSKDEYAREKKCLLCECTNRTVLNDEIVSLEFAWPGPSPKGGQFYLVKPQRTSVFLARPLSAAGWQQIKGVLCFLLAVRGRGTEELAELKPGEKALLTGPLGRGWVAASEGIPQGAAALVSGGVGVAPLACFAGELEEQVFDFYAGFRNGPFGLEGVQPHSLILSSENGSAGLKGRIPDHFSPEPYSVVYACGPEPMLKIIAGQCRTAGVPCFVSLERHMACGVGACLGCTVRTREGNCRCCADGPVFNSEVLFFDE